MNSAITGRTGIHVELENGDSENEESKELPTEFLSKNLVTIN